MPDILDIYQLQNASYGIKIIRNSTLSVQWSPVMKQIVEDDYIHFSPITSGISYTLYLGYTNQSMDIFSS